MYTTSDFIDSLPETSTRRTYKVALRRYLEIVTGNKISNDTLNQHWEDYLLNTKRYESDLQIYAHKTQNEIQLSPKTIRLYAQVAIMYMREAGFTFSTKTLRVFRTKTARNKSITNDGELNREVLQIILREANPRLKAEILIAISSGMRIGEILSITVDDINTNTKPVSIKLHAQNTKTKTARLVFISTEASDILTEWLKIRENLIKHGKIGINDTRIFPRTLSNEITALRKHLKSCGLLEIDNASHWSRIHFHLFRKYFLTEFKLVASSEVAEELAGHSGYLSDSYRRLSFRTIQEEYLKAEQNLTVFPKEELFQAQPKAQFAQIQKKLNELTYELNILAKIVEKQIQQQ